MEILKEEKMKKILIISEYIDDNLAIRESANSFLKKVNALKENEVIIDFTNVTFISNSFAHQYLSDKKKSPKSIKEMNVPLNIKKVINLVKNRKTKKLNLNQKIQIVEVHEIASS